MRLDSILPVVLMAAGAWAAGPLLVINGDFEKADPAVAGQPLFWEKPDGLGVQWVDEPGRGKVIRMDTRVSEKAMVAQWEKTGKTNEWNIPNAAGDAIAETYGLSFYSNAFAIKSGQAYRVTFDLKSSGGSKVWVRGYGMLRGEKRRLYEKVVHCKPKGEWATVSEVFHPTKFRPAVTEMRVMLYAYYPPGVYMFDNVRVDPISNEEYERER
jgi:hypothetical protein